MTSPSEAHEQIKQRALDYARKHKKRITERVTDKSIYPSEAAPVSVFMAGSPGAGKTEASLELLSRFEEQGPAILRIDPDDLRDEFPDYTGDNSWLFQPAVSVLVDRIHDLALKRRQSFLLDGTLSHYEVAEKNIARSLKRDREVQILYVYQQPMLAWQFVVEREKAEGRRIRPTDFATQYFAAREVVNRLKRHYGKRIRVDLLLKNNDGSNRMYKASISNIDHHVPEQYTQAQVEQMLSIT